MKLLSSVEIPNPLHQAHFRVGFVGIDRLPSGSDFHCHNPKAEHIRLLAGPPCADIFRCQVPESSCNSSRLWTEFVIHDPSQAKVTKLDIEARVKHYIACLDVPVNHTLLPLFMEVKQSRRQPECNPVPHSPAQKTLFPEEVRIKTTIGHELVYEQELSIVMAPTNELHQVPSVHSSEPSLAKLPVV